MNSIKVVLLLAFIASANCLISDDIFNTVSNNKQCNQSKSALDSLGIESCRTSGDRGTLDILCNGIKSAIKDICNENSTIALAQVKNNSKFNDSSDTFCVKVGSLKVLVKLSKNVSDTLNMMKNKSCSLLCTLVDGKLNPLCPFLVSYIELKNPPVPKNNTVPTPLPVIKSEASVRNTSVEKTLPAASKPSDTPTKDDEVPPPPVIPNNNADEANPVKPVIPSRADNQQESIDPDTGIDPVLPEESVKGEESSFNVENNDKQPDDMNVDVKSSDDHPNEPENGSNKASEPDPVKISSAEREPFDEAESSHFFTYFVFISALCIFFYVAMYNKKKILALMIEGRRSSVKRRPNSAAYSKLDCTLEEAMASGPSTSSSNTLLY